MNYYVVMLTFDKNDDEPVPSLCYDGCDVYMTSVLTNAQNYKDELTTYNPGCVYEVYSLQPLGEK